MEHSQLPPEVQAANSPTPPASFGVLTDQTFYWLPRNRAGRSGHRSPAEFVLTWQVLRRAVLLALVLGGVLGCCGGMLRVGCQEVVLSADSDGCLASKAPGPPNKLKASPKDGKVILRWNPPGDGACVTMYIVNVIDPLFRADSPAQSTSTGGRSAVVEGLTNSHTYIFRVQAYSSQLMTGGIAQVSATPTDLCNMSEPPAKPTNLRVQTGDGWARLCWDGVDNDACVDQYRVSAEHLDGPDFRTSSDGKLSHGACANVTGLANGSKYRFSVIPTAVAQGQGQTASLVAEVGINTAVQNGWTCRPVEGCAPNRGGLCNSGGGCSTVARRGDCNVPAMLDVDWVNKQVTQWCSSSCPCELGPAQGGVLMGQAPGLGIANGRLGMDSAGFTNTLIGGALGSVLSGGLLGRGSDIVAGGGASGGANALSEGSASGLDDNTYAKQQQQNTEQNISPSPHGAVAPGSLIATVMGGAAADGGWGGAGSLLAQSRMGQFMGNMASDMVTSGVLGDAAGKVAQQVVSNQVNAVMQAMWGNGVGAVAGDGADDLRAFGLGGRRLLLVR